MKKCNNCNIEFEENFLFCTQCGSPLQIIEEIEEKIVEEEETVLRGMQEVMQEKKEDKEILKKGYRLIFLGNEKRKSETFLIEKPFIIGRKEGDIILSEDKYISPKHAKFYVEDGNLFVEDLDSLNGIYIKVNPNTPYLVKDGDFFLIGEQIIKFSFPLKVESEISEQGIPFLGSIIPMIYFLLEIKVGLGIDGEIYPVYKLPFSIGREGCDLNFPDDKFMSRTHCLFDIKNNDDVFLFDKESKNGTFVKIKKRQKLESGELIFIGTHLFRVEF